MPIDFGQRGAREPAVDSDGVECPGQSASWLADSATEAGRSGIHEFGLQSEGWRKYPKSGLLASSAGRGWSGMSAELRSHPAGQIVSGVQQNVEIVIALEGSHEGRVVRHGGGKQQETRSAPRTIWLAPVGIDDEEIILTLPIPRALHLYLPARQFDRLADEHNLAQSSARSIQYVGGMKDDLIYEIGCSVLSELMEQTATGRMFAETSSLMLAARLSHDYAAADILDLCASGSHRLDNSRLRRVLDHIEHHLEEDITVAALAGVASLSAFHFTRMFKAAVGDPPHRYVSRRRLEKAMAMLAIGRLPLCEIAHRSGFASQASFNRAFRRATGVSPGEYRRNGR